MFNLRSMFTGAEIMNKWPKVYLSINSEKSNFSNASNSCASRLTQTVYADVKIQWLA